MAVFLDHTVWDLKPDSNQIALRTQIPGPMTSEIAVNHHHQEKAYGSK